TSRSSSATPCRCSISTSCRRPTRSRGLHRRLEEQLDRPLAEHLDHHVVDGVAAVEAVEVAARDLRELAVDRPELLLPELLDQAASWPHERPSLRPLVLRLEPGQVLAVRLLALPVLAMRRHRRSSVRSNGRRPQAAGRLLSSPPHRVQKLRPSPRTREWAPSE